MTKWNIRRTLLDAGLDREDMNALLPEARDENGHFLAIYSSMLTVIFAICLMVSVLAGGKLVVNRPIYISMIFVGFALYIPTKLVLPRHAEHSTILSILFIVALYGYSFSVSLLHADMQGVAAVAILVVMPSLFYYRPIYMIVMTVAAQVVYCLLSAWLKESAIALLDLWNCLFFGSIAVLLSVFQMQVRFHVLLQKRKNRYLSETDLLTGTKNRNSYEKRRERYAESCRENCFCVYVDVNGLHELNNAEGHEAGDVMLQTVARALIDRFGRENTYRIGGDEFLCFCTDSSVEAVRKNIRDMIQTVGDAGYSVSVGAACEEKGELDMRRLVREAEIYMYQEKRQYYQQSGHDRRSRVMAG